MQTVYIGPVVHSLSPTELQASPRAVVAISSDGVIEWIEHDATDVERVVRQHGWSLDGDFTSVLYAAPGQLIVPGFVDTHTHAPQFPNLGRGGEYELLDWLDNVTFPTESRFSDVDYATKTYEDVVSRTVNSGTTTCCYYGTLHLEATKVLADAVREKGQRAFVGKCNMNRECPPTYIEPSTSASIKDTQALIEYIRSIDRAKLSSNRSPPLVQPILTPRFAISCTDDLLTSIGEIYTSSANTESNVNEHSHNHPPLLLQTHISENPSEIQFTKKLFAHLPAPPALSLNQPAKEHSYTTIYDHFKLLGPRTILAHGVHLTEDELTLIKQRDVGLSHCPGSNFNLRSGVASIGTWLDMGIKVGLGTDVSGGFNPSILSEIRHASIASKVRGMTSISLPFPSSPEPKSKLDTPSPFSDPRGLSLATLLHLATLGGAAVCNLDHVIGSFVPGKEFDALLVDVSNTSGNPAIWGAELGVEANGGKAVETMLERFFFCGDDRNVRKVWVRGKVVGGADVSGVEKSG